MAAVALSAARGGRQWWCVPVKLLPLSSRSLTETFTMRLPVRYYVCIEQRLLYRFSRIRQSVSSMCAAKPWQSPRLLAQHARNPSAGQPESSEKQCHQLREAHSSLLHIPTRRTPLYTILHSLPRSSHLSSSFLFAPQALSLSRSRSLPFRIF